MEIDTSDIIAIVAAVISGLAYWRSGKDSVSQQVLDKRIASAVEKQTRTMSAELEHVKRIADANEDQVKHLAAQVETARENYQYTVKANKRRELSECIERTLSSLDILRDYKRQLQIFEKDHIKSTTGEVFQISGILGETETKNQFGLSDKLLRKHKLTIEAIERNILQGNDQRRYECLIRSLEDIGHLIISETALVETQRERLAELE